MIIKGFSSQEFPVFDGNGYFFLGSSEAIASLFGTSLKVHIALESSKCHCVKGIVKIKEKTGLFPTKVQEWCNYILAVQTTYHTEGVLIYTYCISKSTGKFCPKIATAYFLDIFLDATDFCKHQTNFHKYRAVQRGQIQKQPLLGMSFTLKPCDQQATFTDMTQRVEMRDKIRGKKY